MANFNFNFNLLKIQIMVRNQNSMFISFGNRSIGCKTVLHNEIKLKKLIAQEWTANSVLFLLVNMKSHLKTVAYDNFSIDYRNCVVLMMMIYNCLMSTIVNLSQGTRQYKIWINIVAIFTESLYKRIVGVADVVGKILFISYHNYPHHNLMIFWVK